MPVYHYKCKNCDYDFETFQSIIDEPLIHCEVCSSGALYRVIGSIGISFKGSGFYSTDNKK